MKFFTPITARLLAVAIVVMTAQVTSLPTYGLHRHHRMSLQIHRRSPGDDHGDVSAHDGYEAQLHQLEAALHHYEEYGDAKSLQTYLNGFTGDNSADTSKIDGASGNGAGSQGDDNNDKHTDAGNGSKEQHQEQSDDCEEGNQNQQQQPSKDSSSSQQQQQQPQQQPKMVKKPKKTQNQPSQDYTQPEQQQPKSQPQPEQPKSQPQPQPSQPQTPPESYDSTPAPSKDKSDSNDHHHDDANNTSNKPSSPPPSSSDSSSDPHSIDGYTCPKFETSSAPSTASLYTSSKPFTGRATFYDTGLGACGIKNSDNDPIVAISRDLFEQYNPSDSNPNHNSLCGRKIEITWKGKTVHAFATDECPGCMSTSLDMSPKVFESLDAKEKGVLDGIQWRFV